MFEIFPRRWFGLGHCIPIVIGPSFIAQIEFVHADRDVVGLLAAFIDEPLQRIGVSQQLFPGIGHVDRFREATLGLQALPALERPVEHP